MSQQTIGQLVKWAGPTSEPTCEHGVVGHCDECDFAHCEPINPAGVLGTYTEGGICPHGFKPEDGCFECMGVDMLDWMTPRMWAIVERERATGEIPVA